jgi:hypothetical protein
MYIVIVWLIYVVYITTRRPVYIPLYKASSKSLYAPLDLACSTPYSSHFNSSPYLCKMKLMGINPPMQRLSKRNKHKLEYKHGKHK